MQKERIYSEAEILDRLASVGSWSYRDGSIERSFKTASFKATLMVVATIGHLCEAAWHHPEMIMSFNKIVVKLSTHSAGGITEKDFELAAKIEDVIGWQPGKDGGALEGTPTDPRHAYIRYD